jgi:hypothetical protein
LSIIKETLKPMNKGITTSIGLAAACLIMSLRAESQINDVLLFPKDKFTVETKTVKTSSGEKKVTYHSYMHIQYVAQPVDKDYQSMNVSVPVQVDGKDVDATDAPILFNIGVGGYMSVNNMRGGSGGGMGAPPAGGMPGGGPGGPAGPGRPFGPGSMSQVSGKTDLALAAGFIVVSPGCRGRDNMAADGTFYGKAPASIVDLKAAVRYIRHNKGVMPGNTDWIFSTGVSAGGALSALLGASGNNNMYEPYLKEIGAADTGDNIFASACFCPITDLEHADAAYEWMYGNSPVKSGLVDQDLSKKLKAIFTEYQSSLNLQGKDGFGKITADNYDKYLLQYYLIPSANKFLLKLSDQKIDEYLANNKWMTWTKKGVSFSFPDYVKHVGRMKGLPAFDDFDLKQPEPNEFGNKTVASRHFTDFSLQHSSGNNSALIDSDIRTLVNMMNAMYFIRQNNAGCAKNWWLRQGTSDAHTSQTVIVNLATSLENLSKNVNTFLYWDAGHGADEDAEAFIAWMRELTGFTQKNQVAK